MTLGPLEMIRRAAATRRLARLHSVRYRSSVDVMNLVTAAVDELGADVAEVRVHGLLEDDELHLPGGGVGEAAGIAVAGAFLKGLIGGICKEVTKWGEEIGTGLVRRFRRLVSRITGKPRPVDATGPPGSGGGGGVTRSLPLQSDLVDEFRSAASEAAAALSRLENLTGLIGRYMNDTKLEVAATLRDLGIRERRIEQLTGPITSRLLAELERLQAAATS